MGSAHYSVKNDPSKRTVYLRMEGFFEESEMKDFIRQYKAAVESYGDKPHLVLADMRGMQIASLEVAKLMGESIGEFRKKKLVACCAHLSSSTVQKLDRARVAREQSPDDDVTVNVVSIEEAEKVLAEARVWMGDKK